MPITYKICMKLNTFFALIMLIYTMNKTLDTLDTSIKDLFINIKS